ncbi:hypothetical protein AB0C21_36965 [Spirillospora sp. NPDC049024]
MKSFLHGVLWIVAVLIYIPCAVWVHGTGLELTAGTDSIKRHFASGQPTKIDFPRYSSSRSIFVRAGSPGTPECVSNSPDADLEQRTGHDLTVDGATWRRIYTIDSLRKTSAEYIVTCRAGKGAEFAFGRDREWDGRLLFVLSFVAFILLMVGLESLYGRRETATDPKQATSEEERERAGME